MSFFLKLLSGGILDIVENVGGVVEILIICQILNCQSRIGGHGVW